MSAGLVITDKKLVGSNGASGNIIIPSHVECVAQNCFASDSQNITEISFAPNSSLLSIEDKGFWDLQNLLIMDLRNCLLLNNIPNQMCENCRKLSTCYLPDEGKIRNIGCKSFFNCISLKFINIPPSVTFLSEYQSGAVFQYCDLSFLQISPCSHLDILGSHCFLACRFTRFVVPKSVTQIHENPWLGCNQLVDFSFEANNINFYIENDVVYSPDKTVVIIGFPTIKGNHTLLNSVLSFSSQAFRGCNYLDGIEITGNAILDNDAFYGCSSLKYITISESVKSLGMCFNSCSALTEIIIKGNPTITNKAFLKSKVNCGFICSDSILKKLNELGINAGSISCPQRTLPIRTLKPTLCCSRFHRCSFKNNYLFSLFLLFFLK